MASIWTEKIELPKFPALQSDIQTQVLIIGGGLCGILCAYTLTQAGIPCVLVEATQITHGITENTTAKITSQHGLLYHDLLRKKGYQNAKYYFDLNQAAIKKYEKLASSITCDFEICDSYVYTTKNPMKLLAEVADVQSFDFAAEYITQKTISQLRFLPHNTLGAVKFPNQAQFSPLKFIKEIAKNLTIYEHTFIHNIKNLTALSEKGSITADHIIITTHFPFLNKHGSYFLKQYQERSYVIAYENAPLPDGMFIDESGHGLSFRRYQNYLLIGGGNHRTGKKCRAWESIKEYVDANMTTAREVCRWANQDCMSLDHLPYIGLYSAHTPEVYVATGFNKWGMSTSMVAATMLTDMIMGKKEECQTLFSPSRNMLKSQLFINAGEAALHLLTPSTKRCSHMGCALKWNDGEQCFECPCHGSRFDKNGVLIDNPAKKDTSV